MRLQMRVIFVLKGGSLLLITKRAIMLHYHVALANMFVKLIGSMSLMRVLEECGALSCSILDKKVCIARKHISFSWQ